MGEVNASQGLALMMMVVVMPMVMRLSFGGCYRSGENDESNGSKDEVA